MKKIILILLIGQPPGIASLVTHTHTSLLVLEETLILFGSFFSFFFSGRAAAAAAACCCSTAQPFSAVGKSAPALALKF